MKFLTHVLELDAKDTPTAVTIGNFDGFHLGHKKIINELKEVSKKNNLQSLVLSFSPHPAKFLRGDSSKHFQIFSHEDLKEKLKEEKVDCFILQDFTKEFSQIRASDFFYDILLNKLKAQALIVGEDFSFGRDREGGVKYLEELCQKENVILKKVEPVIFKNARVSSSRIRQTAQRGEMEFVYELLERHFYLEGQVEGGNKRGKSLGFPTANLNVEGAEFLKTGVYITYSFLKGKKYPSITNVGYAPTFHPSSTKICTETFIFQQELEDFYSETLRVEFLKFLRSEIKFSSSQALVFQIEKDLKEAQNFFASKS